MFFFLNKYVRDKATGRTHSELCSFRLSFKAATATAANDDDSDWKNNQKEANEYHDTSENSNVVRGTIAIFEFWRKPLVNLKISASTLK